MTRQHSTLDEAGRRSAGRLPGRPSMGLGVPIQVLDYGTEGPGDIGDPHGISHGIHQRGSLSGVRRTHAVRHRRGAGGTRIRTIRGCLPEAETNGLMLSKPG